MEYIIQLIITKDDVICYNKTFDDQNKAKLAALKQMFKLNCKQTITNLGQFTTPTNQVPYTETNLRYSNIVTDLTKNLKPMCDEIELNNENVKVNFFVEEVKTLNPVPVPKSRELNVLLIGKGGVGKTSFLLGQPTLGDSIDLKVRGLYPSGLDFARTVNFDLKDDSQIKFNVFETNECIDLPIKIDCAIVMYSKTNLGSFVQVEQFIKDLKGYGNVPIAICGNKNDSKICEVTPINVVKLLEKICTKFSYNEISTVTNYQIQEPFLDLIRLMDK